MAAERKERTSKTWGGRFRQGTERIVEEFTASIGFDHRLYPQDIMGSISHCRMLARQGIIKAEEASLIIRALEEIKGEMDKGTFTFQESMEDIHTALEKALLEKIGPVAEKLHTGRSRNDQVSLDTRLYLREEIGKIDDLIRGLQRVIITQAEENLDLVMPGYTHLQRAQPVLLSHHLLAYYEMMKRDRMRYREALARVNISPLGSAALAGSTFDLDREMVARELGFDRISENSMDAVSDRDFALDFLFASSVLMMHLSRLSEEMVIWATQEFDFVRLPDSLCTGSSIMPQKKNPDLPELVRAKAGRVFGHVVALLTVMKGLPLTYNKDMQEDKEALFDTVETVGQCLSVMTVFLGKVSFNREKMKEAVREGHLVATDLAEYLVNKGLSFREAHQIVGRMVLHAIDRGKELSQLGLEEMKAFTPHVQDDVVDWLDPVKSVERRNLIGGTGPNAVRESLKKAKEEIGPCGTNGH
ncbi:MAG: argininosuccinate lyase [Deltaproteobacteria bacterium]|nr:argininosuccinate lyase [Deltaproteobacteria bacterium]